MSASESFGAGGLWSLWDMLEEKASDFVALGETIHDVRVIFEWDKYAPINKKGLRTLNHEGADAVQRELFKLRDIARRLRLLSSIVILDRYLPEIDKCPQHLREFNNIVAIFEGEIASRRCLFIPYHLEKFFENDNLVTDAVIDAFPMASEEILNSGTSLACGLFTASVFHAMRAVEIGLRSMNSAFPITIKNNKPLELAEWREILDSLSNTARDVENRPNSDKDKETDQSFLSEASAQFRFFKNGWRVRVAHARATYNETQAMQALEHVTSFFEVLTTRIREV